MTVTTEMVLAFVAAVNLPAMAWVVVTLNAINGRLIRVETRLGIDP